MDAKEQAEIFREAAAYLEQHGLCKGQLQTVDGRVCAHGALKQAVESHGYSWFDVTQGRVVMDLILALRSSIGVFDVPNWNDADDRTQSEVVKALLQAADSVEIGSLA